MKFLRHELDHYRGYDGVYIAAALTRVFGWKIGAQVVDVPEGGVSILKAWAVRAEPEGHIDIDGVHKSSPLAQDVEGSRVLEALTEKDLFSLATSGALPTVAKSEWDAQVLKALEVVKYDLLMRLSHS